MTNKIARFHSLSRRIVAQFCIFTLVLSSIYGVLTFLLMYDLEDRFIEREVQHEADYLISYFDKTGKWPETKSTNMSLYFSKESLPDDIKIQYIEEPLRNEFYGSEGLHYHLLPLHEQLDIYLVAEVSDKLLVRPVREGVLNLFLISGSFLTLLACIVAWRLGRKTAMPLKKLATLVDGVAAENIPNTFADKFPKNEIGILARTLEESMQRINRAIVREKNFTRDVSHELRTPATVIKNAIEVYQEKYLVKDNSQELINRIKDANVQMEQTITTLLILAREEHASMVKTSVDLLSLVEQSILDHSYLLEGKKVQIDVNDNCKVDVFVQKGMLKVLLDNLISNAFQYTNTGAVKISYDKGTLRIEDTGLGIEKEISNKITEPAVKGSQSTGYGFGLSIVKRLCEHQGWSMNVKSEHGTSISISLY